MLLSAEISIFRTNSEHIILNKFRICSEFLGQMFFFFFQKNGLSPQNSEQILNLFRIFCSEKVQKMFLSAEISIFGTDSEHKILNKFRICSEFWWGQVLFSEKKTHEDKILNKFWVVGG